MPGETTSGFEFFANTCLQRTMISTYVFAGRQLFLPARALAVSGPVSMRTNDVEDLDDAPEIEDAEGVHPRPGDRRPLHRGVEGGARHPEGAGEPRTRRTPSNCLLVVGLPASDTSDSPHTQSDDIEVGGQRGPRGARPACATSSSRLVAAGQRRRGVRDRPPAAIRAVRRPGPVQGLFGSSSQQSYVGRSRRRGSPGLSSTCTTEARSLRSGRGGFKGRQAVVMVRCKP